MASRNRVSSRTSPSIVGSGRIAAGQAMSTAAGGGGGSVPGAPTFTSGPVFAGDNSLDTDTITEQVTATGTGIIDYEFVFLVNNIVKGTKTLTKAQAEASHQWAKADTATTFRMTYADTATTGPGYVFSDLTATSRASSISGVRVRARNATGYSTATFSAGTGSISGG